MYIYVSFDPGVDITDAINEAIRCAKKWEVGIEFEFNGIKMAAVPSSRGEELLEDYKFEISRRSHEDTEYETPDWIIAGIMYNKFGRYELYTVCESKVIREDWSNGHSYCDLLCGVMPTLGEHQFMYDAGLFGVELEHPYWTSTEVNENTAIAFNSAQNCSVDKIKKETCLIKPVKRVRM